MGGSMTLGDWIIGELGYTLDLDGIDDYIDLGKPSDLNFGTGNFTISMWVNPASLVSPATNQIFMAKDQSGARDWTWGIGGYAQGELTFVSQNTGDVESCASTSAVMTTGEWQHVVVVYVYGSIPVLYRNGVALATDNPAAGDDSWTPNYNTSANVNIGRRAFSGFEQEFNGKIGDTRVYNRALNAQEVQELYRRPQIGFERRLWYITVPTPWVGGYTYRKSITIDADTYITGDLTDQPVAVHIDSGETDFWSHEDGDGTYVRFALSDGTLLDFEVESYDATGDDAWFHVKIPTLSASADTVIYMYYGHASPTSGADKENTWDSDFLAVWHHNQDKAEGAFDDSTRNDNDGTNNGTADTAGRVDRARLFVDTESDYINYGSGTTLDDLFAGGGSFEATIRFSGWGEANWGRVFSKGANGVNTNSTQIYLDGVSSSFEQINFFRSFSSVDGRWRTPVGSLALNTTYHVVVTYNEDSASNDPIIYLDGVSQTLEEVYVIAGSATSDASHNMNVGNRGNDREFDGWIDEVTFSDSIRSADWVKARYQSSLGTWMTIGTEETEAAAGVIVLRRRMEGY